MGGNGGCAARPPILEVLERHERRRAGAARREILHRRPRVLEAVHHDPLQALAEHRLHRALEPRRNLEQIGDGAAHADQAGPGLEYRAHARAVALARGIERAQRLELRALRHVPESRVAERRLGGGQLGFADGQRGLEPIALGAERGEGRHRPAVGGLDGRPLRAQLERLGLGRRALQGQALGPARLLGPALAQLAGLAHQVHALARDPHLFEPQGFEPAAVFAEARAVMLHRRLENTRDGRTLGREPLGVAQRRPRRLTLAHDRVQTLAGGTKRLVEPHRLLAELPYLHAHLLPALQQALELALHLLHALTQIRQRMVAGLDDLALPRLPRGQRRHARALGHLRLTQALQLGGELRRLRGQRGVIGRDEGQRQVAPLVLQRLVLLRLFRLALERIELAAHLVHHVAHAHEVLARLLELALGLVALLLVTRDARGLLDEHPALVRLGGQDVVELVLVHDGVGARVRAGAGEEVEDVAQPRDGAVQHVLALARAIELPAHRHLAPRHGERPVVAEEQLHLGQSDGLARGRAVEDEVFHALATQRLGALLAEGPAHGLANVALPAAVGTDDRGDPGQHLHDGLFSERLEAVERDGL